MVAPDTGFKRIEEVNKQEGKYFKKQRHIGRFDFYMIGKFFFFLICKEILVLLK